MNKIKDGALFNNVSPYIRSLTPDQLADALTAVKGCSMSDPHEFFGFDPEGSTLIHAFSWACAPQGSGFWSALHAEFKENFGGVS